MGLAGQPWWQAQGDHERCCAGVERCRRKGPRAATWMAAPLLLQGAGTTGADEAGDGLCEHGSDCPGKASDDLQEFLGCTCPYRGPSLPSVSLSLEVLRNVLRGRLYFTRTKHGQSRSSTAGEREEDGLWQGLTASLLQLWHHPASPALFTSKG